MAYRKVFIRCKLYSFQSVPLPMYRMQRNLYKITLFYYYLLRGLLQRQLKFSNLISGIFKTIATYDELRSIHHI